MSKKEGPFGEMSALIITTVLLFHSRVAKCLATQSANIITTTVMTVIVILSFRIIILLRKK